MRNGIVFSILFHLAVIVLAMVGLPRLGSKVLMEEQPLVVDLVELGERTAAPPAAPRTPDQPPAPSKPAPAKPEPPKPEPPKPEPPKPPPPPLEPAAPEPEPEPAPMPDKVVKDEPKPAPAPAPEPEPEPADVGTPPRKPNPPKPPPTPPKAVAETPAEPKKEPPKKEPPKKTEDDPFAALVKNVEKFRQQQASAPAQPTPATPSQPAAGAQIRNAPFAAKATMTERDHIRAQIERHWLIDAGAQGLEDMAIVLTIRIDPAGNVVDVRVAGESWARYTTDSAYRAVAESARRAALKASPLDYPREKYDIFRDMELVFRPQNRL
jgi:outer membrane biosynthesis protein TonB